MAENSPGAIQASGINPPHRTPGGIVAGAFLVIPSIFILIALSYVYVAYGDVSIVAGALDGFKPVVVAIVVEAVLKIGKRALKSRAHYAIAAAAFVGIFFLHVPFPLIVLTAGLVGLAMARYWPGSLENRSPRIVHVDSVNEDTPLPTHTRPSRGRALRTLAVGIALWVLPFTALVAWRGWSSLHAQEYLFFTQAGVAAKYLARPEATVATISGCGDQGRISLRAIATVRQHGNGAPGRGCGGDRI